MDASAPREPTTRPPIPSPAERARTIAARSSLCAVLPASSTERVVPHLHHVHPTGRATLLLPDEHALVVTALQAPHGAVTAMLELTDPAPVPLREPVRGLLWVTGMLRLRHGDAARRDVLAVAEQRPDPRLLDAGHGYVVLRLETASIVLADAEGTGALSPLEFTAASVDPFHNQEAQWLRHLEASHRDVVHLLSRHLPDSLRGGHIRPLGLDRLGLRLRVEAASTDHDVRLAFSHPVDTPRQLAAELRQLVGCPFLAKHRG
ncbi:MAG: DUF2470 domain-containing protein [Sciscionella sp.]